MQLFLASSKFDILSLTQVIRNYNNSFKFEKSNATDLILGIYLAN